MFYVIISCVFCDRPCMIKEIQKTKTCPYCGKRFKIKKAKVYAKAKDPRIASLVLKHIKEKIFMKKARQRVERIHK